MNLRLAMPEEDDEIDITPMIDCVFLLVLFFMVTSSFIEEAQAFKITLPRADESVTIARDKIDAVSVTLAGEYYFRDASGEQKLDSLEVLLQRLRQRRPEDKERPVLIRCDARCEYQQFVQVKNVLKLAGVAIIFEEVEVRDGKGKP